MQHVYAEMDILLTLEQYKQAIPETLACYIPYSTLILFESIEVPITSIVNVCNKPLSLLRHDSSTRNLRRVDDEVRADLLVCNLYTQC